jgi:CspA family cold shock protein
METGTIKRWLDDRGFGFIKPDLGGADVFVHISAVERAGYSSLAEGARISYELIQTRDGRVSAGDLKIG